MFKNAIKSKDGNTTYTIIIKSDNDLPECYIFDKEKSYNFKVKQNEIEVFAKLLELDPDIYLHNLKSNLEKHPELFHVLLENNEITFIKNNIKYYKTTIREDRSFESYDELLDLLIEENRDLKDKALSKEQKKQSDNEAISMYKAKLEEITILTENREKDLFNCFVQLLNEKKKRTSHLENLLTNSDRKKARIEEISDTESNESLKNPNSPDSIIDKSDNDSLELLRPLEPIPSTSGINITNNQIEIRKSPDQEDLPEESTPVNDNLNIDETNGENKIATNKSNLYSTQDILDRI